MSGANDFIDQRPGFFHKDEAAGDDFDLTGKVTSVAANGDDDDDDTISAHVFSVGKDDVANITNTEAVDHDVFES